MSRQTNKIRDEIFFPGGMNSDDDPRFLKKGDYLDAVNVIKNEDGGGGIIVTIKGNEILYNPGNSEFLCGWTYYDKNESVILFIYYIDGGVKNKIVEVNPHTSVVFTVILDNTLLGFQHPEDDDYFIKAGMIGDWIAWTDNVNPPRMINIVDIASVTDLSTYLDLHKIPPVRPPRLSMGLDDTITYNNITTGFQFKYRYVYGDYRSSVYSPGSDLILSEVISRVDNDSTTIGQENYINIQFNSGNANVTVINLAVREGNIGTWFKFSEIKKASPENVYLTGGGTAPTPLVDNTEYIFRFYNNEGKIAVGDEADRQYDRVPDKSESLSFSAENNLILGGNTEGKDLVDIDVTLTPQYNNPGLFDDWDIASITNAIASIIKVRFDWDSHAFTNRDVLPGDYVYFDWELDCVLNPGANPATYSLQTYVVFTEKLTSIDDIGNYLAANTPNPIMSLGTGSTTITYFPGTNELEFSYTSTSHNFDSVPTISIDDSIVFNRGYDYNAPYGYINDLAFKRTHTHELALIYEDKYGIKFPALTSADTKFFINSIASSSSGFANIQYTISSVAPVGAVAYRWAYAYTPKNFAQTFITDVSYFENPDGDLNLDLIALDVSGNSQFYLPNYNVEVGDYIKIIQEGGSSTSISGDYVDDAPEFIIKEIKSTINDSVNDISGTWLIISPSNVDGYNYDSVGITSLFMNALIEIYKQETSNFDVVYYEIGSGGTCVGGTSNHDDWFTGNATGYINQGDIWVRPVTRYARFDTGRTAIHTIIAYLEDPYPYINAPRKDVGISDVNIEVPESRNKYDNTLRHSNKFFQDTKINGLSTFLAESKVDVSDSYGHIKGLEELGDSLVVICEEKVLAGRVGATEYTDTRGSETVAKSTDVIGFLRPHSGIFGTFLKGSILNTGKYIYFFDLNNKCVVRKASNGLYPISGTSITPTGNMDFKMRTYFKQLSDSLLLSLYTSGVANYGSVRVYMGYDFSYNNIYITFVDSHNSVNNTSLIFHEPSNRWVSRYTSYSSPNSATMWPFTKTALMSYMENEGILYLNNSDNEDRLNLYQNAQNASIKFVSNEMANNIKVYDIIAVHSNDQWKINNNDAILIPENSTYSEMSSKIPDGRWRLEEGVYRSEFLRNAKSTSDVIKLIDLYNGELLRGYTIIIEMINSSTDEVRLFKIDIDSELSK